MKFLLLGGSAFLGPALIDAAVERGHKITVFNRGHRNVTFPPEVEVLHGDRREDLSVLRGGEWDAVIDTSGYLPGVVRRSAELLSGVVGHYTFISSISAYAKFELSGIDESAPLKTITAEELAQAEAIPESPGVVAVSYGALYGGLKALCEQAATAAMPGRVLNVRPGLIAGPRDYSDRFTYWVRRVAQGGLVLAPGRPDRPVRVIDVRDLAEWIVRMVDTNQTGTFNATGPESGVTMATLLADIKSVTQSNARFTWASDEFLSEHGVAAWSEMPLWIPDDYNGIFAVNNDEATADGLTFRPLTDTIRATWHWDQARDPSLPLQTGLDVGRESELLKFLHESC